MELSTDQIRILRFLNIQSNLVSSENVFKHLNIRVDYKSYDMLFLHGFINPLNNQAQFLTKDSEIWSISEKGKQYLLSIDKE